ncbi:AAA family ATPase [Collinsella sp. LCP19S3_C6]|uniref:AAA family ATPase n=1 Tax=unclassified Collinsella TaxID=2637548 RepID=UPI003F8AA485
MRFKQIEIHNYRQYRDLTLEFRPGDHDLQLIVADNGVGKTNLLNAFTWCLYGDEPHLGNSKYDAGEPKLNKEVIAECVQNSVWVENVSVIVTVELGDTKNSTVKIKRSVPFRLLQKNGLEFIEKKAEEQFTVTVTNGIDGQALSLKNEGATAYINRYLPESIREYFFFDGEQLNTYFQETKGDRIKEAVYSISQIDVLSRTIDHLKTTVSGKKRDASAISSSTAQIYKKLDELKQTRDGDIDRIERNQSSLFEAKRRLSDIDGQLRGVEDVRGIENEREAALELEKSYLEHYKRDQAKYYEFVRKMMVDFNLYPVAKKTLDVIERMEREGHLPPSIDPEKLQKALSMGTCTLCGHSLNEDERAHIEAMLNQFKVSSETSNILSSMRSELKRIVDSVKRYPAERKQVLQSLKKDEQGLEQIGLRLNDINARITKFAESSDDLKRLFEEREQLDAEIASLNQGIGAFQSKKDEMDGMISVWEKKLNAGLEKDKKTEAANRAISFGNRALSVLKAAEKAIVDDVRKRMESRTEALFKGLVWKNSKCDRIELTERYQLSLYDRQGYSCAGTCSAAERSLLALSFTLAMHEVSGFDSPLFIDTPIARASGENRENFAKTLVEVSKNKQLILAFTPDEYSEAISREFEPAIATYTRLRLDEQESEVMKEVEYRG